MDFVLKMSDFEGGGEGGLQLGGKLCVCEDTLPGIRICIKMMNFGLKMMDFAFKMMDFGRSIRSRARSVWKMRRIWVSFGAKS